MPGSLVLETLHFLSVNFLRKIKQSPVPLKYISFKTLLQNISSTTKMIPRYTELYSNIIKAEFHTYKAIYEYQSQMTPSAE